LGRFSTISRLPRSWWFWETTKGRALSSLPCLLPSSLLSPLSSLFSANVQSLTRSESLLLVSFTRPITRRSKTIKVLRSSENEGEDGKTCLDSSAPFAASEANPGIDFYTESMAFCQQRETSPAMCRKEGSDGALGEGRDAPVLSLFFS